MGSTRGQEPNTYVVMFFVDNAVDVRRRRQDVVAAHGYLRFPAMHQKHVTAILEDRRNDALKPLLCVRHMKFTRV